MLVIANIRNAVKEMNLAVSLQNTTWMDAFTGLPVTLSTTLNLKAFEYRILVR